MVTTTTSKRKSSKTTHNFEELTHVIQIFSTESVNSSYKILQNLRRQQDSYTTQPVTGELIQAVALCIQRITKTMPREASKNPGEPTNEPDANDPTTHSSSASPPPNASLAYLTLYRSTIYALTFVAILAVDFSVFPRRFCKTELAGYGLMDVGAASFCVSGGIVAGKAYAKQRTDDDNSNLFRILTRPLWKAAPLILIGIIRTITNKELDYQEHVSEYGVHWNFFFTLSISNHTSCRWLRNWH